MDRDLARRASAEAVGTALLVAIVVGSGIAAQRLSPGNVGLQLLENSIATGAGLIALILALGSISGAHFNPVVTLADRVLSGIGNRAAAVYIAAQVIGGCAGAIIANLMFSEPAIELSTHTRSSGALWLAEFVATFGLLLVILGVVRAGQPALVAFAVGGYIAAAYWFTSSTSFANPAVTVARTLTDTFAGIRPSSAPAFVVMQALGAAAAVALWRFWSPTLPADDIVMPHDLEAAQPDTGDRREMSDDTPTVLFLCIHNAGRSQMALGWFKHLAAGRAVALSGGSEPAHAINPVAVAAMAEVGIDIAGEVPTRWTDAGLREADVVVTMGCGDTCPYVPGTRYEDWPLADPAGQGIDAVRPIRDEIRGRVVTLLATLGVPEFGATPPLR